MTFQYGDKEINYLKDKDEKLALIISKVGYIERDINDDLFSSIVYNIIGQQISRKAQETIWKRFYDYFGVINTQTILKSNEEELKSLGISYKKAEYIIDAAKKIKDNELDIKSLAAKSDEELIKELTKFKGIGVWTAEMILIFCFNRLNVFSFNDYAIRKGLSIVYGHEEIRREIFEKYRRLFSPYCTIASFYLWEVANSNSMSVKYN